MSESHDFRPTADWQTLSQRARLLRELRRFFDEQGYLEVETPVLSADTVVDCHLEPIPVCVDGRAMWLQTSPEFAMKRLLAAGAGPIYQVTKAFRGAEQGTLHNTEFTMVEWYTPGDPFDVGMRRLGQLAEHLLARGPARCVSYATAFADAVGIDPHRASSADLAQAAASAGVDVPRSYSVDDRDAWLQLFMMHVVEPGLGRGNPTILFDYPASQAMLARVRPGDPPVAERFELYVDGFELANGYHELLDAAELRRRCDANNQYRLRDGRPPLPDDSRLLAAMRHGLPACTGVALGFDRLVMAALGKSRLAEVIAFPVERA